MSKILIVGNIIGDTYLKLNEQTAKTERDAAGVEWLNMPLDGKTLPFYRETETLGGAAVTAETLAQFGHEVELTNAKLERAGGEVKVVATDEINHRYILTREEKAVYLVPEQSKLTKFKVPTEEVDWILIDQTASLDEKAAREIAAYLSIARGTRVAIVESAMMSPATLTLKKLATVVFSEDFHKIKTNKSCGKTEGILKLGGKEIGYRTDRMQIMTELTVRSMAAATMIGALMAGESDEMALKLARANIENATLDRTLAKQELYEIANEMRQAEDLAEIAKVLMASEKGILAADESGGSIHKKFEAMGIADTEKMRRDYRNVFFTTPDLEKYVNGVILFDETARQRADDGRNFTQFLTAKGIIPGIKVDKGLLPLPGTEDKYTAGLEGLPERLEEYTKMGLKFAKWRAAFEISADTPSKNSIWKNCENLACYAKNCQEAGIVPIVEPEVVHAGNYSIEVCQKVTEKILKTLFVALKARAVYLPGCILKCNMVLAGSETERQSTPEEVGRATVETLRNAVPKELAGVVFLSGGQSATRATENLAEIIKHGPLDFPMTFSFARALQAPALETWRGDNLNAEQARLAFLARLKANCAALKAD